MSNTPYHNPLRHSDRVLTRSELSQFDKQLDEAKSFFLSVESYPTNESTINGDAERYSEILKPSLRSIYNKVIHKELGTVYADIKERCKVQEEKRQEYSLNSPMGELREVIDSATLLLRLGSHALLREDFLEQKINRREPKKIIPHIRWFINKDLPEATAIENAVWKNPWSEKEMVDHRRERNCISLVVEHQQAILGYIFYTLHRTRLHITNVAVDPLFQRKGLAESMIKHMKSKLHVNKRTKLLVDVRERNLDAQFFFKKMGFRGLSVLRDFFEDTGEDAYLMQHALPDEEVLNQIPKWKGKNRIEGLY